MDSPHSAFQPPPSPAPTISFPKESWHVRSARRDHADRENDGVNRCDGHEKKKRKLGESGLGGLGGGLFDESYRVKVEQQPTSSFSLESAGDESGLEIDENSALGSPLFPGTTNSHNLVPLTMGLQRRASVPTGSSLKFGGLGNNVLMRTATDPFPGAPGPYVQDTRRSLTNPPPSISHSRRPNPGVSSSSPPPHKTSSKNKAQEEPVCHCLADPSSSGFVAHLSKNVRSTWQFLETRHRSEGRGDATTFDNLDESMKPLLRDCGVMRALSQLERAIKLSSCKRTQAQASPAQHHIHAHPPSINSLISHSTYNINKPIMS
ncbi:uncharacterized protein EI90DRAFT_2232767 [Cantharellus anzutake]|uniref:uncharacterized protein n=1 Tax=Cantharellus anzutake TaxID=1750568 RepID=UPI0019051CEC|nr:uncharacterized protein EI90DRAFT_2232767 [Cantharellus anzutake]KAF8324795.1 hypothetical protein EI90DRAFT_2232767 [Cantharellus anzutake]